MPREDPPRDDHHTKPDPRFDDWPLQDKEDADIEWLGLAGGTGGSVAVPAFYEPETNTVYRGEVDEENERIVPTEKRRLDDGESLGDHIESLGEELGWESLSEFARDHLDADEDRDDGR